MAFERFDVSGSVVVPKASSSNQLNFKFARVLGSHSNKFGLVVLQRDSEARKENDGYSRNLTNWNFPFDVRLNRKTRWCQGKNNSKL